MLQFSTLFLVGICCWLQFAYGLKIYFESFEQTHGEDWMWCDLRVRKFNRTSTVINGTIHVLRSNNNDLKFHVDLFYSRLGNQQYNYYPAKLPTAGVCDFITNLRQNYPSLAKLITNLPEKNECPISVRKIFEQTQGQNLLWCDLRVRKINRTTAVLNGTVHFLIPATNEYQLSIDLFHSPLGNQQFNHYPMKLPTSGACDFIDSIHENFPHYVYMFVNLPAKNECPASVREVYIRDECFPSDLLPPVMPPGLWKAWMRGWLNGTEVLSCYVVWKLLNW
uniref:MD-2-related lipid-recognition domain-containing protein n=1 Tax=Anopheles farauti TaxID=69004 RepID=A0A182QKG2_9DIPT